MGLVQPATAVLYDYYSPGEHSGSLASTTVGVGPLVRGSEGRGGSGSVSPHVSLILSRSQVFCVLCCAHQEQAPVHLVLCRRLPVCRG